MSDIPDLTKIHNSIPSLAQLRHLALEEPHVYRAWVLYEQREITFEQMLMIALYDLGVAHLQLKEVTQNIIANTPLPRTGKTIDLSEL